MYIEGKFSFFKKIFVIHTDQTKIVPCKKDEANLFWHYLHLHDEHTNWYVFFITLEKYIFFN